MKTLADLITYFKLSITGSDLEPGLVVEGLSNHTGVLQPNWGFVALEGVKQHGADYWREAAERGACCILSDKPIANCELPVLVIDKLNAQLAALADWFYASPSKKIQVIGITGTNGKTSTTHYLAQMLEDLGYPTGMIGTLGNGRYGQLQSSANTTPDVLLVQYWLAQFVQQGLKFAVMEVSSHGLALGRIRCVEFACVALTQVTRDHLDFHADVADYQKTKTRLFTEYQAKQRVVNRDDAIGRRLLNQPNTLSYSLKDPQADLLLLNLNLTPQGLQGRLAYQSQTLDFTSALMGQFNAENLLCAVGCLVSLGFSLAEIASNIASLEAVKGRMQTLNLRTKSVMALVDYAHTPDALEQVLLSLRAHLPQGQIWLVFGCGGDRDKGKRPLMGEVAERLADQIIVTSDNPRTEPAQAILDDIVLGMTAETRQRVYKIVDRKTAIETALQAAKPGDLVLVAGKGHEQTQEIQGTKIAFSDQQVIEQWQAN